MIKAIIFDMGGVIVTLDPAQCISNFKELAGFDCIEDVLDRYHQKGFISDFEEGKINVDQFYAECFKRSRPGTSAETIRECFTSLLTGLREDTMSLIKELHGHYDLYILSNNNPISRQWFCDKMVELYGVGGDFFKDQFYSYEMHLLKPSRKFYEAVVQRTGVKPEEILFIDDARDNIEAAEELGINTVWFKPEIDVRAAVLEAIEANK